MKIIVSMILALTLALGLCGALAAPVTLPAYVYPGDDPILAAVTHYMVDVDQRSFIPKIISIRRDLRG